MQIADRRPSKTALRRRSRRRAVQGLDRAESGSVADGASAVASPEGRRGRDRADARARYRSRSTLVRPEGRAADPSRRAAGADGATAPASGAEAEHERRGHDRRARASRPRSRRGAVSGMPRVSVHRTGPGYERMCDLCVSGITQTLRLHAGAWDARGGTFRAWRGAASTPCSPSAGCAARGRARPRRCAPGGCGSGRDGAAGDRSPGQLVAEDAELARRGAAALRLARRDQARERARRARARRRRARLPRRRRLDRRLHRLPAAARRRAGDRARRRPRPARLGAAQRRAGARDRARQRPRPRAGELPFAPQLATIDVSFISLAQGAAGGRRAAWRPTASSSPWSSRSSSSAASGSARAASSATPADRREALLAVADAAARARPRASAASRPRACPGPKGNRETFVHCAAAGDGLADVEAAIAEVEP